MSCNHDVSMTIYRRVSPGALFSCVVVNLSGYSDANRFGFDEFPYPTFKLHNSAGSYDYHVMLRPQQRRPLEALEDEFWVTVALIAVGLAGLAWLAVL